MVVGVSMSGKSFFVKQMLERDHVESGDPRNLDVYICFMDISKTCIKYE